MNLLCKSCLALKIKVHLKRVEFEEKKKVATFRGLGLIPNEGEVQVTIQSSLFSNKTFWNISHSNIICLCHFDFARKSLNLLM